MKKILLASSALAFAGSAFAADLPPRMSVKAPVVAAVPFSWTGCYVGAQAGYGWGNAGFSDPTGAFFADPGVVLTAKPRGALAGGQIGCNYQFASNWVLGIEGDYAWANLSGGNVADPFFDGKNFGSKTDALASVTGRIGYTWDRVLFYGRGGAAWAHDRYTMQTPSLIPQAPAINSFATETRSGWVAGAGFEWAFAEQWSAKFEYDHYDFGTQGIRLRSNPTSRGTQADVSQRIDTVKIGINYRFWSPGAAVTARY